ncbi:hypothetical protein HBI25_057200 [Parastagonospora nodorum]|nr:hypothetical protein HBH53_055170 [Parastagonospora nodorum]KAH3981993.1 hypothetical protein HBH51_039960 [Parastagonospora nodorum]KAH3982927.1 hypothetical protein HBH52_067550 [Parastagonospora nodorum]KAH4024412.1 hypothetical protein HBI09_160430 [Parastagonospora nodorum]KAH4210307.1 hypothetical protein HBI95_073800 [Parastagonospora nodorum]
MVPALRPQDASILKHHWRFGTLSMHRFVPTTYTPINIRRVTLRLKKLHTKSVTAAMLGRNEWKIRCYNALGKMGIRTEPSVFSWKKLEKTDSGHLVKGLKRPLKQR